MQLSMNYVENEGGEPLKLSERFLVAGVTFFGRTYLEFTYKMIADFLLISHQPISVPSRLVRPLKRSLA